METVKVLKDGTRKHYKDGVLHRTDGPAIEWANGHKHWYQNGLLHRTDGPAVERLGGTKEWWVEGQRHRTDGPAAEWANGDKEWWINGEQLTEEDFEEFVKSAKNDIKILHNFKKIFESAVVCFSVWKRF